MSTAIPNAATATGPTEDLTALFRSRREPMARLAYVLTSNAQASDEIVRDTFLNLHANWARIENPVGYLRTTVINGCHSYHRRRVVERRQPTLSEHTTVAETDEISEYAGEAAFRAARCAGSALF